MGTFTITSDDTLTIYDRVFNDLSSEDTTNITFADDLVTLDTGKNKNTIFAKNEKGNNASLVLRVIRGSSDDQFLSAKQAEMDKDFAATVLANGQFVKRLGDGDGNTLRDVYTMQGGMIVKRVEGKENVSGDTDQAIAIYNLMFAVGTRGIQ